MFIGTSEIVATPEWMRFARSGFDGAFANASYPEGSSRTNQDVRLLQVVANCVVDREVVDLLVGEPSEEIRAGR